jgi:hypothetical protein
MLEFILKPSTRKNKKYDVYQDGKYLLSFGDKRYEHYKDLIGHYSNLNHLDKKRRDNYRKRAEGIGHLDNYKSPNFWSYWTLWS